MWARLEEEGAPFHGSHRAPPQHLRFRESWAAKLERYAWVSCQRRRRRRGRRWRRQQQRERRPAAAAASARGLTAVPCGRGGRSSRRSTGISGISGISGSRSLRVCCSRAGLGVVHRGRCGRGHGDRVPPEARSGQTGQLGRKEIHGRFGRPQPTRALPRASPGASPGGTVERRAAAEGAGGLGRSAVRRVARVRESAHQKAQALHPRVASGHRGRHEGQPAAAVCVPRVRRHLREERRRRHARIRALGRSVAQCCASRQRLVPNSA